MRYKVIGYNEIENDILKKKIIEKGHEVVDDDFDIVIPLGGDGTFLSAINSCGLEKPFLPINAGTLGFMASYEAGDIYFDNIDLNQIDYNDITEFNLMNATINNKEFIVVNEVRITNREVTSKFKLTINHETLDVRASGLEIITAIGSTGWGRANGGAIINPGKELYQINSIFPLSNRLNRNLNGPIVLDYNDKVDLSCADCLDVVIDGTLIEVCNIESVDIKKSEKKLKIINSKMHNYYELLQKKIF